MMRWTRRDQAILEAAPDLRAARLRLGDGHPTGTIDRHWYATRRGMQPLRYAEDGRDFTKRQRAVVHTLAWVMAEAIQMHARPDWSAVLDAMREVEL